MVELEGEILDHCVQCGYSFSMPNKTNTVFNTPSTRNGQKALNKEEIIKEVTKGSPSLSEIIKRVQRKVAEQNNKKPTTKTKAPAKKKSWFFTMMKWLFLLVL